MKKSEVYSWRVDPHTKQALEDHARAEGITMARLIDRIVGEWLDGSMTPEEEAEQRRLHAAAAAAIGTIRGGDPSRASRAGDIARAEVQEKFERRARRRRPPQPD